MHISSLAPLSSPLPQELTLGALGSLLSPLLPPQECSLCLPVPLYTHSLRGFPTGLLPLLRALGGSGGQMQHKQAGLSAMCPAGQLQKVRSHEQETSKVARCRSFGMDRGGPDG